MGDFLKSTARLTDVQSMTYLRLMWMYYETEQPLDADCNAIAFKLGANASDVSQILRHFFFEHDGKWHHARCDKEIIEFRGKSDKAKMSADARWNNANAMRTQCERNANASLSDANHKPLTINHKPVSQKQSLTLPDWLDPQVWADFVKHRGSKFTSTAQRLAIAKLDQFRQRGHDPTAVINESIANGWKGLFEPKSTSTRGYESERDKSRREFVEAIHGKKEATIEGSFKQDG